MDRKVLLSWSGGKDAAFTLHTLRGQNEPEVAALLTTLSAEDERVLLHGMHQGLLERQAQSLGIPLEKVFIPAGCSDEGYGRIMGAALEKQRAQGVSAVAFGDLYLEGVRRYREEKLKGSGVRALFPLWGMDTRELARAFIEAGFRALVVCVDTQALDKRFLGREYDRQLLADLPPGVDPCGEDGEFHTFVYDGPIFRRRLELRLGGTFMKHKRYLFQDLRWEGG